MLRLREESQLERKELVCDGRRGGPNSEFYSELGGVQFADPNRPDVTELGAQNKHSRHQGRSHHRDSSVRDKSVSLRALSADSSTVSGTSAPRPTIMDMTTWMEVVMKITAADIDSVRSEDSRDDGYSQSPAGQFVSILVCAKRAKSLDEVRLRPRHMRAHITEGC